jgi:hypothetical protein
MIGRAQAYILDSAINRRSSEDIRKVILQKKMVDTLLVSTV